MYNYQSGFIGSHSTNICLSQLTDMILNCAENGPNTGMNLIDLKSLLTP